MPEYLSPGVYIEELPPQLRAIEGVSTSTAGFVGVTQRGPCPGFPLPFTPLANDPQVVTLVPDPTPVLVTSFSDFLRQFGKPLPLPDPNNNSYVGYAGNSDTHQLLGRINRPGNSEFKNSDTNGTRLFLTAIAKAG
jgi:hypothetical protein